MRTTLLVLAFFLGTCCPAVGQDLPSWAEPSDGREAPERFEDPVAPQGAERDRHSLGRQGQQPPVGAQRPGQRPEGPRTNVWNGCENVPFFDACKSFCDSFPKTCRKYCSRHPNDRQCRIACENGSGVACQATGVPLGGQWILVLVALGLGVYWLPYNPF